MHDQTTNLIIGLSGLLRELAPIVATVVSAYVAIKIATLKETVERTHDSVERTAVAVKEVEKNTNHNTILLAEASKKLGIVEGIQQQADATGTAAISPGPPKPPEEKPP